jgi:hypothetical protein
MVKQFNQFIKPIFDLLLINPYCTLKNEVRIRIPCLKKKQKDLSNFFHNSHAKIVFIGDKYIDIEFFKENENMVNINIQNSNRQEMYALETFIVPTLHIIIETCDWPNDIYTISIKNENFKFLGDFILENSFM